MKNPRLKDLLRGLPILAILLLALTMVLCPSCFAEENGRWGTAADEIDRYLDAGFEYYLEGNTKDAYTSVNNAYFRVYEVTGFERQTMSYISGNRKNAIEMQFSTCKANVKREELDLDTKIRVRSSLMKLKTMIREDANKLAEMQGEARSEIKYYLHGELVKEDPYADLAADPDAAAKYENWYEAATLVKETLDTAYMAYLDKDFEAASDNLNTAFYLLERLDIADLEDVLAREVSGGERRRASIIRALLGTPDFLLADEPTSDLDDENVSLVLDLLKEEAREGRGVLVITHDQEVLSICDDLYQMEAGILIRKED
ncbi:MAG: ATP-binding cassette domain-containing protein [Blautia sp.]|nr:ATP-binding cassette domain-containing protein [Blautia sp.]